MGEDFHFLMKIFQMDGEKRHEKKASRRGMFLSSKMSKDDSPGNPSSATAGMSSRNYQGRVGESSEFSMK